MNGIKINKTICDEGCPIKRSAEVVGYKWTTLIFRDLLPGPKSFSQLHRSVAGISEKMLMTRLKFLQEKKLVTRKVLDSKVAATEYSLTSLGKEIESVLREMAIFGEKLS